MSALPTMVLAGDIGGTKTLLLLGVLKSTGISITRERRFDSHQYDGLLSMLDEFLRPGETAALHGACFGVAGPVVERRAKITNLPWWIDADEIAVALNIRAVTLINDFSAIGYGIEMLPSTDLETLQLGHPVSRGVRAILGAGTGLGMGFMTWCGEQYRVFPSEGSHADFAPANLNQAELLHDLTERFGHVSYERLISGQGLVNIYTFLRSRGGEESSCLRQAMAVNAGDQAAAISAAALHDGDLLAQAALDWFTRLYGAAAGNLALTLLPTGGLFVAGGIAPKIIDRLRSGEFVQAFRAKGRFSELLATIPVHVVMNSRVGLLGAALVASRL